MIVSMLSLIHILDSSAAAFLLKEQGYSVIGVTMRLWPESSEEAGLAAIEDARQVADTLNIPFHVLDFRSEFESGVITYFMDEYRNGRTPNPCVICNRRVKWTGLLQAADRLGAAFVATGHYARVRKLDNGRFAVCRSATDSKDQTYALYNLTQEQLSRTLMPVSYTHLDVYKRQEPFFLLNFSDLLQFSYSACKYAPF